MLQSGTVIHNQKFHSEIESSKCTKFKLFPIKKHFHEIWSFFQSASFWFLKNARAKLNQQQGLDINRVPKCVQHPLKICISQKCFTNFAKIQVKFQNLDFFLAIQNRVPVRLAYLKALLHMNLYCDWLLCLASATEEKIVVT